MVQSREQTFKRSTQFVSYVYSTGKPYLSIVPRHAKKALALLSTECKRLHLVLELPMLTSNGDSVNDGLTLTSLTVSHVWLDATCC